MPVVVSTEAEAYRLWESVRWGDGPLRCPHCGQSGRSRYLAPRRGGDRRTRTGRPSGRRVWKCGACLRQFSVLTGTVLEGTRIPLRTWLRILDDLAAGRSDHVAAATARRCGLTVPSARAAVTRLRLALPDLSVLVDDPRADRG